ncbi:RICIN domain-containing protein [Streptomyces sp. S12]|nr:RICIN domain-containing protein [Streptomyces sp. S12]
MLTEVDHDGAENSWAGPPLPRSDRAGGNSRPPRGEADDGTPGGCGEGFRERQALRSAAAPPDGRHPTWSATPGSHCAPVPGRRLVADSAYFVRRRTLSISSRSFVIHQFNREFKVPPQPKPQDPALLDGASSRFAKAFSSRATKSREGGNPGSRPWIWIACAAALTACIIGVIFAVAHFPSGDKAASGDTKAAEGGSAQLGDLRGTALSDHPGSAKSPGAGTSGLVPGAPGGADAGEGSGKPAGGPEFSSRSDGAAPSSSAKGSQPPRSGSGSQSTGGAEGAKDGQTAGSASRQTVTYQGVQVRSHNGGRCIAASGGRSGTVSDGTRLVIWDCEGGSWQKIDFRSDGTARMFGLCMDLAWAGQSNGTAIQLAQCNGGWAQKFEINSAHDLVNTEIGKCVDVVDNKKTNGAALQLWNCSGSDNQKWSKR